VIHVIKHEPNQPRGHDQRIPLHQSPLKQSRGIAEHACQNRWTVDADSVDDPFVPPTGECGNDARDPSTGVYHAVDDIRIEPRTGLAESHGSETHTPQLATTGEDVVVSLIDVVLVEQRVVDGRSQRVDGLGVALLCSFVSACRQEPSAERYDDR